MSCFAEKVLERGEKIELLVDKTDRLNQQAFKFEKQSKKLKNAMWWKNMKMMIFMGVIAVVAIYIVAGMICGFDLKKCTKKS